MLPRLATVLQLFALIGNGMSVRVSVPLHLAVDLKVLKAVEGNLLRVAAAEGFHVSVKLGTPPQKLNLFLDTGSSDVTVASYTDPNLATYFRLNESASYESNGERTSRQYVEGFFEGTVGSDVILLPSENVSLRATLITMSSSRDIFPVNSAWQGILGLSYPSLTKYATFVQALGRHRNIYHFTLKPCNTSLMPLNETCGTLEFGGNLPPNTFFTPVIKEWFYGISLLGIAIGASSWPGSCIDLNGDQTIVDTGTSDLKFPQPVYDWVIDVLSQEGYNLSKDISTVYCLEDGFTTFAFTNLHLHIPDGNGQVFVLEIPPEVYFQNVVSHSGLHNCYRLGISPSTTGSLIGFAVLRSLYTTFDMGNSLVGFSELPFDRAAGVTIWHANYTYAGEDCMRKYNTSQDSTWGVLQYMLIFIGIICTTPALIFAFIWARHRVWICGARNKTDSIGLVEF